LQSFALSNCIISLFLRTVIAHTRFATSSANKVSELHPHEWTPFKEEVVWKFNSIIGKYERSSAVMGVHITHNGDFDELEAYQQVRGDVLLYLCIVHEDVVLFFRVDVGRR
jgi:hypothetical protein